VTFAQGHDVRGTLVVTLTCLLIACSPEKRSGTDDSDDETDGEEPIDASPEQPDAATDLFPDAGPPEIAFPAEPLVEPGVPANAPELFEPVGPTNKAPCLLEPPNGALIPKKWLRPRFKATADATHNLFEWRFAVASQANELRVYTNTPAWTMPLAMWKTLNLQSVGEPITLTVRSARHNGSGLDAPADPGPIQSFTIAPVEANGSVVYWTVDEFNGGASLKGFRVGDEDVSPVMTPPQAGTICFGCHNSTPDGKYVAFDSRQATSDGRPSYLDIRSLSDFSQPPFLTPSAKTLMLRQQQHAPTFSDAHWVAGDRKVVTTIELAPVTPEKTSMIWTDLEAATTDQGDGWGVITRTGDTGNAGATDFSHDGTRLVYVSAPRVTSGINLDQGGGDLWTVPFNDGAGGLAEPLAGAASPQYSESYPTFSADDELVTFTRVPPTIGSYEQPASEVWVVPSTGGTSVRLAANDPPACSNKFSPGLTNSWPKWSPRALASGDVTYYFMIFSSDRVQTKVPQLYMTALTVDASGSIQTYPAVHLWNQPANENNHTPAWDVFDIVVE
jgi:hypothetical protein